ncbi:MAG TPA: GDP-mannose 4,6-dehydratase, partial [Trichormus sp.]
NKVLSITGDGNQTRDFVHVDDVVEAFSVGAFAPLVPGSNRVFNVGTGEEISVLAIVRLLEQVSGVKVTTVFASAADDREPSRSVADVTMSRRHLGFSAQVQVSDGLRRVWNAMRDAMPSAIEESRLCS